VVCRIFEKCNGDVEALRDFFFKLCKPGLSTCLRLGPKNNDARDFVAPRCFPSSKTSFQGKRTKKTNWLFFPPHPTGVLLPSKDPGGRIRCPPVVPPQYFSGPIYSYERKSFSPALFHPLELKKNLRGDLRTKRHEGKKRTVNPRDWLGFSRHRWGTGFLWFLELSSYCLGIKRKGTSFGWF